MTAEAARMSRRLPTRWRIHRTRPQLNAIRDRPLILFSASRHDDDEVRAGGFP